MIDPRAISNWSKKISLILLLNFCILHFSFSQFVLQGKVTDLGDNSSLGHVRIEMLGSSEVVHSDEAGNFEFLQGEIDFQNSNTLVGKLVVRNFDLAWIFNSPIDLFVFNQLGETHSIHENIPATGRLELSNIRKGMYFVRIYSKKGMRMYSLFSSGNYCILATFNEQFKPWGLSSIQFSDTLVLSHDDYYVRKIPIQLTDNFLEVGLLKHEYDILNFLNELISRPAFDMLSSSPSSGHRGEVESVKIIYNKKTDQVYFMNTNLHQNHYEFSEEFLGYKNGIENFTYYQYTNNPARYLYPATINFYNKLGIYTFEFFPADGATCNEVEDLHQVLLKNSFIGDKLFFHASNDSWNECTNIPTVSTNDLFGGQNYQALNNEETFGYLKKVDLSVLSQTELNRHDILLVNGIPFDIPVISGIITTEFQTPLSHINVLSHNRGTPNMCLRDGFENQLLDSLLNKLIYLKVEFDKFLIREASIEEANKFWNSKEPQKIMDLPIDSITEGLIDLDDASYADIKLIGGKAANFAELINAFSSNGELAPVPEHYFAIPFSYYKKHLNQNQIGQYIFEQINSKEFKANRIKRQEILSEIRNRIIHAPLNEDLVGELRLKLSDANPTGAFRFRSSTNAEDIKDFNGAGLYSSFTCKPEQEESIEQAVKKAWASLWNYTAFEEREYFKINHSTCAMGILAHRSFPDEDANGVAITENPYNSNSAYIINVQLGEESIVDPEPGVLHDQIILYTFSISGSSPFTYEYITNSNLLPLDQKHVLSEDELLQLGRYLSLVKNYFYRYLNETDAPYDDFGLDIEFKIDSETSPRKLYLKQVRPY